MNMPMVLEILRVTSILLKNGLVDDAESSLTRVISVLEKDTKPGGFEKRFYNVFEQLNSLYQDIEDALLTGDLTDAQKLERIGGCNGKIGKITAEWI